MIPLRTRRKDAISEYEFDLQDPFLQLKLPKKQKVKIYPLSREEWSKVYEEFREWCRPYFEFAISTGLRPSEQVALKWSVINEQYINIELSSVTQGGEKDTLKTTHAHRKLRLRPKLKAILERQKELTKHFNSEYVFLNTIGKPADQKALYVVWLRALKRAGIPSRRLYETRHTFASWALSAGEQPSWVARTLGHSDLTMVYTVYGQYIPDLIEKDGGKFDDQFG